MEPIIEVLKLIGIFTIIFLVVYLPIERMVKNKPWYYRGLGLLVVALLSYVYSVHIGWRIGCYLADYDEIKCGLDHSIWSMILALFFTLMGIVWLIKDGIFRPKKL